MKTYRPVSLVDTKYPLLILNTGFLSLLPRRVFDRIMWNDLVWVRHTYIHKLYVYRNVNICWNPYTSVGVHMYTRTHVRMYTCTHVHMHACKHVRMYACTHVHMYACTHAHMYKCTHVHMCACTHVHTYACTHAHMYACTHVRMYTRTHVRMHTCTHVRMHTCTHVRMYTCPHVHMSACTHVPDMRACVSTNFTLFIFFWTLQTGRSGDRTPVGLEFPHPFGPALGSTHSSINEYRVITGGKTARAWRWPRHFI